MPQFDRFVEANVFKKNLLTCFHGGYLWQDTQVLDNMELISQITGFPMQGLDQSQYFHSNDNDKRLAAKLKQKYGVDRDNNAYVFNTINDREFHIAGNIFFF